MSLIEKIARDLADALGDNFDYAFNSKPEWTAARGETKAGFRDVNQPFKPDYLDAAQAALTAIMDAGDGVPSEVAWKLANKIVLRNQGVGNAAALIEPALVAAAAAERAKIVAWLRGQLVDEYGEKIATEQQAWWFADAIERGEV